MLFGRVKKTTAAAAALSMVGVGAVAILFATPASATPGTVQQRSTSGVTADALPTAQIDGVVWSQAIVGNTVYAGGSFKTARPAGAAAGRTP